jgi:hypothetical protein
MALMLLPVCQPIYYRELPVGASDPTHNTVKIAAPSRTCSQISDVSRNKAKVASLANDSG